MSAERWSRAEQLFLDATELPESERDRYLTAECGPDTALREEVLALLRYDRPSTEAVDLAIQEVAAHLADDLWIGRNIGSYRITKELGAGGMGSVYLGERADQRFEKQVAIKLVHRAVDSPGLRNLLMEERRILAALDHPYIAKLIDGGETEEGIPYFVMEYVDGEPVHRYAAARGLSVADKCELMRKVCEGVAYAHRRLVVHLDLKPSNIVVTNEGTPKLLDFGIASLLQANEKQSRIAGAHGFTPEYASPELMEGLPITIAADVFSLGVVMRELLTGSRKPGAQRTSRDLEAIVDKATQPDAALRYASPEELSEDIARSLRQFPVTARSANTAYSVGRFLQRHRIAVAGITLAFAALAVTAGVAVSQAKEAKRARAVADARKSEAEARALEAIQARANASLERDRAVSETAIAEQRLGEFTSLADNTVGDLNNLLERLPGATEGRRAIVADTLQFLDKTRAANPDNLAVLTTVASGYLKMSQLLGQPYRPNLGDVAGAKRNLEIAETISSAMLKRYPDDERMQTIWLQTQSERADFLDSEGRANDAVALIMSRLPAAVRWRRARPDSTNLVAIEVGLRTKASRLSVRNPKSDALVQAQMAIDLAEPVLRAHPDNFHLAEELGSAYGMKQQALVHRGQREGLRESGDRAIEIGELLLQRSPDDVLRMRTLAIAYGWQARVATDMLQDRALAKSIFEKALLLNERISAKDPANIAARTDVANALLSLAEIKSSPGEQSEAFALMRRAAEIQEAIVKINGSPNERARLADTNQLLGRRLWQADDAAGAIASARRALDLGLDLVREAPDNALYRIEVLQAYHTLLPAIAKTGGRDEALLLARDAMAQAQRPSTDTRLHRFLPRLWMSRGDMFRELADPAQACTSYLSAAEAWRNLEDSAKKAAGVDREIALAADKSRGCPGAAN